MLKMACRSRSKLATNSSESVVALCGCIMTMSFGQFATYEVLSCGLGRSAAKEKWQAIVSVQNKKERRKDGDRFL